jgi:hypothetical protein
MDTASLSSLSAWLTEASLAGKSETALLDGFSPRALDAGLRIARAAIIIDTLHPVHKGRAFLWRREGGQTQTELVEYGPTSEGEGAENWRRSVFFHLLQSGGSLFLVRFHAGETAFLQLRPNARRGNDRRRRDDHPFRRVGGNRRWGFALFVLGNRSSAGLRRRACGGAGRRDADAGACGEMRFARAHRRDACRNLWDPDFGSATCHKRHHEKTSCPNARLSG